MGSGRGVQAFWGYRGLCSPQSLPPSTADCPLEDSGEEQSSRCDLTCEDIMPAVKTLIRAVR